MDKARAFLMIIAGALLSAGALAGCHGTHGGAAATGGTSTSAMAASAPSSSSGPSPASPPSPSASATASGPAPSAGGRVPRDFAAASVTFVSPDEGFVLGTAPCARKPCTSILRTLDRGASWHGLPAPRVPLGDQAGKSAPAVRGIRFASPSHGFVFGAGLWETRDAGEHWAQERGLTGEINSLDVVNGQVLALVSTVRPCVLTPSEPSCPASITLLRRPLDGGDWEQDSQATGSWGNLLSVQHGVAAAMIGTSVVVTGTGGRPVARHTTPCDASDLAWWTKVAVTGPDSLALMCVGQGYTGNMNKTVYVSGDLGAHWTRAGSPNPAGDPISLAGGSASRLTVDAASNASWLYYSPDGGHHWRTAYRNDDGGVGFRDLGFTTPEDGVVVHGPPESDSDDIRDRPGQLLLTSDGGASWHSVRF